MPTILLSANSACPCGTGRAYGVCCGLWHAGLRNHLFAPTPELLMRSRYAAYVLELEDYLLQTWHASSAPQGIDFLNIRWMGLEIHRARTEGASGLVEFVAKYKERGRFKRLRELSHFTLEQGQWKYLHGEIQDED